jgi:ABC-type sugar transport system substrate-binding protein
VRHPPAQGRRRVAAVTGPLDTPGGVERLAGYREVLAEEGVAYDERLVVSGDYSRASGEAGAELMLTRAPELDAVFVAADLMGAGRADGAAPGGATGAAGRRGRRLRRLTGGDRGRPLPHRHPPALGPDQQ